MAAISKRFGAVFSQAPPPAGTTPETTIQDVFAHPVVEPASKRPHILVEVKTKSGITGWGEAPARPMAAERFRLLTPMLRNRDALARVPIDEAIRSSDLDFPGARAAIDIALLDLLGKISKAPLYEVLGGPTRHKLRAMAALDGQFPEAVREQVTAAYRAGFRAFSVPLQMPTGPRRGRSFYRNVRRYLDSLRAATGEETDFVLDCGGRTTPAEALAIANACEEFHLLWLDEPSGSITGEALAALTEGTATPAGYGRYFEGNARFQELLRLDAIDVLRPSIAALGITQIKKAAAIAETYYIAVAPYNHGSPVATAAALHLGAALPNFFIQETPFTAAGDREMRDALAGVVIENPDDGFFPLPPGPGLGVQINRDVLKQCQATTPEVRA